MEDQEYSSTGMGCHARADVIIVCSLRVPRPVACRMRMQRSLRKDITGGRKRRTEATSWSVSALDTPWNSLRCWIAWHSVCKTRDAAFFRLAASGSEQETSLGLFSTI